MSVAIDDNEIVSSSFESVASNCLTTGEKGGKFSREDIILFRTSRGGGGAGEKIITESLISTPVRHTQSTFANIAPLSDRGLVSSRRLIIASLLFILADLGRRTVAGVDARSEHQ
jgi:hypothetical protein